MQTQNRLTIYGCHTRTLCFFLVACEDGKATTLLSISENVKPMTSVDTQQRATHWTCNAQNTSRNEITPQQATIFLSSVC